MKGELPGKNEILEIRSRIDHYNQEAAELKMDMGSDKYSVRGEQLKKEFGGVLVKYLKREYGEFERLAKGWNKAQGEEKEILLKGIFGFCGEYKSLAGGIGREYKKARKGVKGFIMNLFIADYERFIINYSSLASGRESPNFESIKEKWREARSLDKLVEAKNSYNEKVGKFKKAKKEFWRKHYFFNYYPIAVWKLSKIELSSEIKELEEEIVEITGRSDLYLDKRNYLEERVKTLEEMKAHIGRLGGGVAVNKENLEEIKGMVYFKEVAGKIERLEKEVEERIKMLEGVKEEISKYTDASLRKEDQMEKGVEGIIGAGKEKKENVGGEEKGRECPEIGIREYTECIKESIEEKTVKDGQSTENETKTNPESPNKKRIQKLTLGEIMGDHLREKCLGRIERINWANLMKGQGDPERLKELYSILMD